MEMETINHLSHPHLLKLTELDRDGQRCEICSSELTSLGYACQRCYYWICRTCGRLPQKMQHPFHPQHTIVLLKKDLPIACSACGLTTGAGYLYDCEQCKFCLDIGCAALRPTHKYEGGQELPEIKHQHPLIICDKPKDNKHYACTRCYEPFEDDDLIYSCLECISLLDQNCAALPNEIQHPFHHEHPLTFLPGVPESQSSKCCACGRFLFPRSAVYHCSLCNFTLDFHCTTLRPVLENSVSDQGQIEIQPATHPHPLIQCSSSLKKFYRECYGCGLPFKDSIYVCLQCGILLHKSCADLPREIKHPLHLQHSFRLYENTTDDRLYRSFDCKACESGSGDFVYVCQECDFLLDIRCATANLLLIKSKLHKHALALFDFEIREFRCNICHRRCYKHIFRCVECNFNIHNHCHPSFPKTIKHDCHCDPLTFTTSKIKNYPDEDEDEEFYCSACEETRDLDDPAYYCAECHFVAHVHCVFSEILPHLQYESMDLAVVGRDEATSGSDSAGIATKNDQDKNAEIAHELSQEIATLKNNIDSLSNRIDELMEARNQRIATLEYKLTEKSRRTGVTQPASWSRQPVSIGFETAEATVSYI